MICCPINIIQFGSVDYTDIAYSGQPPMVEVMYFIDGVLKNAMSVITMDGSNIHIDHGGPSTGIIKLSA